MYALRRREAFERLVVRTSYFPKRGLSTAKRRTLYDTLGVASTASDEEIRQAFRNRAKELHPDIASAVDPSAFVELLTAREVSARTLNTLRLCGLHRCKARRCIHVDGAHASGAGLRG